MTTTGKFIGLCLALVLVASACGDSDRGDSSASEDTALRSESAQAPPDEGEEGFSDEDASSSLVETSASRVEAGGGSPAAGRDIIRTASLTVRVENMPEAIAEVEHFAAARGGFVANATVELEENPFAVITVRVPQGDFDLLVKDLGSVGELLSQEVNSQDVTGQVTDLSSRIASAEISIDRLRGFLERAENVSEIAELEAELSRREADAESMKAQLRGLEDRVSLTTVSISLTAKETPAGIVTAEEDTQIAGFSDGLSTGWGALLTGVTLLSALLGLVLPFLPFVLVGLVAVWIIKRKSRQEDTEAVV